MTDRGTPPVGTPSRDPELKRSAVEQVFNPATGCEDTVEVGPLHLKPGGQVVFTKRRGVTQTSS